MLLLKQHIIRIQHAKQPFNLAPHLLKLGCNFGSDKYVGIHQRIITLLNDNAGSWRRRIRSSGGKSAHSIASTTTICVATGIVGTAAAVAAAVAVRGSNHPSIRLHVVPSKLVYLAQQAILVALNGRDRVCERVLEHDARCQDLQHVADALAELQALGGGELEEGALTRGEGDAALRNQAHGGEAFQDVLG